MMSLQYTAYTLICHLCLQKSWLLVFRNVQKFYSEICAQFCFYISEYLIVMLNSFIGNRAKKFLILQSDTQAELFPIKVKQKQV